MKLKKNIKIDETNIDLETVVNNCVYSTTEKIVGKWKNNKNLYEKTIELPNRILLNASWQDIVDISQLDVSEIPDYTTLNDIGVAWYGTILRVVNNKIQLYYIGIPGAEWYVKTITIKYTKRND